MKLALYSNSYQRFKLYIYIIFILLYYLIFYNIFYISYYLSALFEWISKWKRFPGHKLIKFPPIYGQVGR